MHERFAVGRERELVAQYGPRGQINATTSIFGPAIAAPQLFPFLFLARLTLRLAEASHLIRVTGCMMQKIKIKRATVANIYTGAPPAVVDINHEFISIFR